MPIIAFGRSSNSEMWRDKSLKFRTLIDLQKPVEPFHCSTGLCSKIFTLYISSLRMVSQHTVTASQCCKQA